MARSRIRLSICISPHIFIDRYIQQNSKLKDNVMMNQIASSIWIKEPTSVLPEIISRINYLSLDRHRINLSICISPHIFIDQYNITRRQFDDGLVLQNRIDWIWFEINKGNNGRRLARFFGGERVIQYLISRDRWYSNTKGISIEWYSIR